MARGGHIPLLITFTAADEDPLLAVAAYLEDCGFQTTLRRADGNTVYVGPASQ